jgi:hypothetical protein
MAGFALPGAAYAQDERGLTVQPAFRAVYDSNIARSSEEVARARGLVREDVRLTPGLGFRLGIPLGFTRFYLEGEAGYDFHLRNERLDRERLQSRAGLETRVGRCVFGIEGQASRSQIELDEVIVGPAVNRLDTLAATGTVSCSREAGISPFASVGYRQADNSQELRRTADYEVRTVEGGLAYRAPTLGELVTSIRHRSIEYPNRRIAPGATEGFNALDLGVRFSRNLGSAVRGVLSASYTEVETDRGEQLFSGLTYAANFRFLPNARLQPALTVERRVDTSNRIGSLYQVEELVRAEALYRISPSARASVAATWSDRRYQLSQVVVVPQLTREDRFLARAAFDLNIRRNISLGLFAEHEKREADVPLFDFESTRIGLSTRLTL